MKRHEIDGLESWWCDQCHAEVLSHPRWHHAPGTPLSAADVQHLYHLTHLNNIGSIAEHGLLSSNDVKGLRPTQIHDPEVEALRDRVGPAQTDLHAYALLYVNPRPPMYFVCARRIGTGNLGLVRVSTEVLRVEGTLIADQNVAIKKRQPRWATGMEGLSLLDRDEVFGDWRQSEDPELRKARTQAEVLVESVVDPRFLVDIIVASEAAAARVRSLTSSLPVQVVPNLKVELPW